MTTYVAKIVDAVQAAQDEFIEWPTRSVLLMPGVTREKYHDYPETITKLLRDSGMRPDGRSNGPAICSYLLAGGQRPLRSDGKGWSIHHIYDGRFPYPGKATTTHAVKGRGLGSRLDKRQMIRGGGLVIRQSGGPVTERHMLNRNNCE